MTDRRRVSTRRGSPRTKLDQAIEEIYAEIPDITGCDGSCAVQCTVIYMQRGEFKRVKRALGGRTPRGLRADGRCQMLAHNDRCMVYSVRPYICRLWGTVEEMKCPKGCRPERWLTKDEARSILGRLIELLGGETDGPLGPINDLWEGIGLVGRAERLAKIEAIKQRRRDERRDV